MCLSTLLLECEVYNVVFVGMFNFLIIHFRYMLCYLFVCLCITICCVLPKILPCQDSINGVFNLNLVGLCVIDTYMRF